MFAKSIRKILDERGISIAELSRRTGVPKSNINSWLQGSSPNLEQIYRVSKYLGITIESLAFGHRSKDLLEDFFEKVEIYKGEYEISIKKISRKELREKR
jgi:transcriptional regulator with XRE-family HTH domain